MPYSFQWVDRYSDQYPVRAVKITAVSQSSESRPPVHEVGAILEADKPNPCLLLNFPLGFDGVRKILDQWRHIRLVKEDYE